MANSSITLYVDDTGIRLMATRGKRITKLAEIPLDANLSSIDTDEKVSELGNKIKNLIKSNKIGTKKVILGLSGLHCLTRPIILPDLPRTMLDEAIMREAKRVLPVPVEQLYISWQIVSVKEGKIQAFIVATPRQIADTVINALNKAGYKPYLMDIKPLALARLSKEADAIIIDVQTKEFDIVILSQGMPQPIRTIAFPEEELTLQEKIEIVKDDLKRTIQFHNSNNTNNRIELNTTMLVSGELAEEQSLYESLAKELGLKVSVLASPLKCMKQLDPSHHLVNVGLTFKEMVRESGPLMPNFNTLPTPYQPKQISLSKLVAVPSVAAAVGAVIMLALTIQNTAGSIDKMQADLDTTNTLLEKRQSEKKEESSKIANLEQKISSVEADSKNYEVALKSFYENGNIINSDLKASIDNIIQDLELQSINHNGKNLSLNGDADSEKEIITYVRKLNATGRFSSITIANIISSPPEEGSSGNGTMSFSLNVKLKDIK
jgi:type IV pilus assembly protein PilM